MNEFHFLRPAWFLALLPMLFVLWRLWRGQYHSRSWQGVCDPKLLPFLLVGTTARHNRWPLVLAALIGVLVITALAGPTWQKLQQPVFRQQSSLVIVLDLSRSMDATDIKPSRLTRARHKLIDILRKRKEGQTALIVYAGDAYTVSPLTDDSQTMLAMVKTLSTDLMPTQGSRVDLAISRAIDLLKQAGAHDGHILLVTDGVDKASIRSISNRLHQTGHRLSVLGVGTAEGAPISIANGGFLKDQNGAIVIPKLDSGLLRELATEGGGRYRRLSNDDRDLDTLLGDLSTHRLDAEREQTSMLADHWREEGPWLLLVVLPLAALGFRRGYLILLLIMLLPAMPKPAYALEWQDLWQRPDQKAAAQLKQNESATPPADVFTDPEWQAAAHYRSGQYQQAAEALKGIDKADALYNKGNALARLGRYPAAKQAYEAALKKDPNHADAKHNLEEVEKMLQQQSSEQQKQGSGQQQSNQQQDSDQQNADQQQSEQRQKGGQQQQSSDKRKQDGQAPDSQSTEQKQNEAKQQRAQEKDDKQAQAEEDKQAQHSQQKDNENKDAQQQKSLSAEEMREQKEQQQATEQWLRRIPDDPGGLLRRKFQYEYQRKQAEGDTDPNQNGQQAW